MAKQPVLPIHLIAGRSADFPGKIRRSNHRTCQAFQTGNSEPYNRPVPLKTAQWKCKSAARALSLSKLPPTARGSQRHTPPAPRTCVKQKDGKKCRPISYRTGLRSAVRSSLFCVSSCSVTPLCVPLLSASSPYDDRMDDEGCDRYRDDLGVGCKRLAVPFHRV